MTKYWILPLWLTSHSPLLCGLLLARCQYSHRSNIVWVDHPTSILDGESMFTNTGTYSEQRDSRTLFLENLAADHFEFANTHKRRNLLHTSAFLHTFIRVCRNLGIQRTWRIHATLQAIKSNKVWIMKNINKWTFALEWFAPNDEK